MSEVENKTIANETAAQPQTAPTSVSQGQPGTSAEARPQRSSRDFRGGFRSDRGPRDGARRDFRSRNGGKDGGKTPFSKKPRNDKRPPREEQSDLDSQLIEVKRVTRVVKGGKRMRFAALVVVGDKKGQVGMGFMKGVDFQDAVAKATRKAKDNLVKITVNDAGSIDYPIQHKFKSANLFMKPANKGTGLIAGGYLRPVLELAGVENIYTKIIGSNNKISGVQAAIQALQKTNK